MASRCLVRVSTIGQMPKEDRVPVRSVIVQGRMQMPTECIFLNSQRLTVRASPLAYSFPMRRYKTALSPWLIFRSFL